MTDQKIQQLAREIATENYKHFGDEKSIDLMAHEYEDVIKRIARTHCIVSKEKVKALEANIHGNIMYAHNEDDWQEAAHYILDVMPRRFVAVFGTELFEERSENEY